MAFSKFLDPKNDFCFKRIFGSERNKDILVHFLNDMLEFECGARITDLTFLKPAQDPDIAAKKQSIVDVLCRDEQGRSVIVEMQVAKTRGFEKRAQYYAAKAYVSQMGQGDQYPNLKEIIFLAITDYVMFADKAAYKSNHVILDKYTYDHDLKDFSFTFLELPKFTKDINELGNNIERWSYFLKHAHETAEKDLERIVNNNTLIGRAYEELNQFSWSEQERFTYEQVLKHDRDAQAIEDAKMDDQKARFEIALKESVKQGMEQGMQKGIEQGIEQGRAEGKKIGESLAFAKIARAKHDKGMNIADIADLLDLNIEEINDLLQ